MANVENLSSTYELACIFDITEQGIYYRKVKLNSLSDYRDQTRFLVSQGPTHAFSKSSYVDPSDSIYEIENLFKHLATGGRSNKVLFVLGYRRDPFGEYNGLVPITKKLLELFEKYKPGRMLIQTCSNLIVLNLAALLPLKKFITVNFMVETNDQRVANRFSASRFHLTDRLKAAQSMKIFGFDVEIQVAPLLPCAGGRAEIKSFVDKLISSSNRIYIASAQDLYKPKAALPTSLIAAGFDKWIQPAAIHKFQDYIRLKSPEHLEPLKIEPQDPQLNLFVA